MASSARAYRLDTYDQAVARPRRASQVRVVPGTRPAPVASPVVAKATGIILVALLAFIALSCVRVGLAAATVSTQISQQDMSAEVKSMRSANAALAVQQCTLSSQGHIHERATQLGMTESPVAEQITLSRDVVAFDSAGNLSLSASLSRAAS